MQVLEKKTKGFTLLELLVVIAILGILSATAYPNLSSWIKERKVRQAAEKIKNLISSFILKFQLPNHQIPIQIVLPPSAKDLSASSQG